VFVVIIIVVITGYYYYYYYHRYHLYGEIKILVRQTELPHLGLVGFEW